MALALEAVDFLLLPGRGNSNGDHWIAHWAGALPNSSRVLQRDWHRPTPEDWIPRLDAAIAASPRRVVLIAHSVAVAMVVRWADAASSNHLERVAAALLVCPSDVEDTDPAFDTIRTFAPMPRRALPFPTLVLASSDDPRVTTDRARGFAKDWLADFLDVGPRGHLGNVARPGLWPEGLVHLGQILSKVTI